MQRRVWRFLIPEEHDAGFAFEKEEGLAVGRIVDCRENGPMPLGQTGHLRHCSFIATRDDKKPTEVVRET